MLVDEQVILNERMGAAEDGLFRLVLKGVIAAEAQPGQFVHIKVAPSYDPPLRRPISIAGIDREKGETTLFYRLKGRGTELLSKVRTGERLSVMGPLGRGFSLPEQGELLLVAGGIGVFPLLPLTQKALACGLKVRLFWGGESERFLQSAGLSLWQELGLEIDLSTMDGSAGHLGLVTESLGKYLQENAGRLAAQVNLSQNASLSQRSAGNENRHLNGNLDRNLAVAACGPQMMMRAVAEECAKFALPLEVSLEERMGCAVGACLGCVCTLRTPEGQLKRAKVCQDGPVFRGEEVVWNAQC